MIIELQKTNKQTNKHINIKKKNMKQKLYSSRDIYYPCIFRYILCNYLALDRKFANPCTRLQMILEIWSVSLNTDSGLQ